MSIEDSSILIVDDDEDILTAGKLLLKRVAARVVTCNQPHMIPELMAERKFDAILLDMNFGPGESSGAQGFHWLGRILDIDPDAVIIMITAHGGVDLAVDAMKLGATDFVAKPWQNEKVAATLKSAVALRQTRHQAKTLKKRNRALAAATSLNNDPVLYESDAMKAVMEVVEKAAPTDANILILGENGTGKELIARSVHRSSLRRDRGFVSVDLGAISESLFESELFGHKKGAFTGAKEDRVGRLEAANGGTLFLDELGNLPLHLQSKLLSVIEQRQVIPLGSNEPVDIDVRIISATNVPREELANEDKFRTDLLFRLNTVEITLPALRERPEDIALIAEHFADVYARKYNKGSKKFAKDTIKLMQHSAWPGNIRALRHAIERAIIMGSQADILPSDMLLDDVGAPSKNVEVEEPQTADLNLDRIESKAIAAALKKHRYNISHAAKELGLTRAALYRRMEKHGL